MRKIGPGFLIEERYQFVELIGEGGMGKVYLADDLLLSRKVAIKTLHPQISNTPEVAQRIDRECRLHARLGVQPNLVALYDRIVADERIFLIMEYVEGVTLDRMLLMKNGDKPVLTPEQAVDIIGQVLVGIQCIHNHGMVHNDVKPANILLYKPENGNYLAKLMDFGIAALPVIGEVVPPKAKGHSVKGPGTPTYMAPECIDGRHFGEVGNRSDLYAAGVILYQLLAGQPPFTGSMKEILTGHLNKFPDIKKLESKVAPLYLEILEKALQKEQDKRYQSASSFSAALAGLGTPVNTPGDNLPLQDNKPLAEKTLPMNEVPKSALYQAAPTRHAINWRRPKILFSRKRLVAAAGVFIMALISTAFWHSGDNQTKRDSGPVAEAGGDNLASRSADRHLDGTIKGQVDVTEYRLIPPITSTQPTLEPIQTIESPGDSSVSENALRVFHAARQEKLNRLLAVQHEEGQVKRVPPVSAGEVAAATPVIDTEKEPAVSEWKVVNKYSRKIGP